MEKNTTTFHIMGKHSNFIKKKNADNYKELFNACKECLCIKNSFLLHILSFIFFSTYTWRPSCPGKWQGLSPTILGAFTMNTYSSQGSNILKKNNNNQNC